jgi:hypothetical protein
MIYDCKNIKTKLEKIKESGNQDCKFQLINIDSDHVKKSSINWLDKQVITRLLNRIY